MPTKSRLFLFILIAASVLSSVPAAAQNITGIWRGYFITDERDQYKFELQIQQSPSKRISGVSYSYLSTVFYGKATLNGYFDPGSKSALVQEIKTVELRMSGGSMACIMKCQFTYSRSGNEEFLEGTYTSTFEKSHVLNGTKKGDNCGGGKIYLRKVPTSDFYVEPFLRDRPTASKLVPKPAQPQARTTPPKPQPNKPATKSTPAPTNRPPANNTTAGRRVDTVQKIPTPPVTRAEPKKQVERPALQIPTTTRARTNELLQTVQVQSENVTVRLYDNGEIDGDTISVYMDNQLVLSGKRLSASPLTINLQMSEENPEHVLVMVAENLGRIPPNTSLMIVYDGDRRYEVRITSTEQKNAMIRFRYVK